MSLIYKITAPAVRTVARRQLEEGMKAPAAYMKKMKTLQKKPLPLERLRGAYDFEEKRVGSTVHYMVHSRKSKSNRVILYLHGGGFCRPLKADDFEFAEEMADETGADVWLVDYALFPDATGKEIAGSVVDVYLEALKKHDSKDIAFYGNSAGAALCFTVCVYLRKYMPVVPLPGMIVSHSPCIRIPTSLNEQEKMNLLDQKDIIIPAGYVNMYAERPDLFQTGGFEEFASPIDSDWSSFPRTLVVFGSDEVFLAYLPAIIRKCREDHVELETYVGKGRHCYCAKGILPEAHAGRERIYAFLCGERRPWETMSEDLIEDLNRNQQGELDAVIMYRMLADRMDSETDANAMRRLADDELRHARIFRKLTGVKKVPGRTQGDAVCLLYRTMGKAKLFRLMARGEYAAVNRYSALSVLFPQLEEVMEDEQKHGDALMGLCTSDCDGGAAVAGSQGREEGRGKGSGTAGFRQSACRDGHVGEGCKIYPGHPEAGRGQKP